MSANPAIRRLAAGECTEPRSHHELAVGPDERWWGGAVDDGSVMPFGARAHERDLATATLGAPSSQSAPILVSTNGRYIASDRPFRFTFADGRLSVQGEDIVVGCGGETLADAYRVVSSRFFPASGTAPAAELFAAPQYNIWIEQPYAPTQESVLRYARGILDAGMPPGVLIIDDSWAPDYGTWRFDLARFPDPAAMTTQLHDWGFSVMLWVVPFVSPDSLAFRQLESQGLLLRDATGEVAVRRWWNGLSAIIDLSQPAAISWLTDQLDELIAQTMVDGFKFDGGDIRDFREDDLVTNGMSPADLCEAWAQIGLRYPFNEYRACWRMGGQPLAQRLQDKPPHWDESGIRALVPEMLAQGMIGHPFVCPDMIGGGEIIAMTGQREIDQEFFVRYAQIAAVAPMAQFSVMPARVLDQTHLTALEEALALRAELQPLLNELVDAAARTGEPIMRPMAYHAPEYPGVADQFFVGPDLFFAPVLEPAATSRTVAVPAGTWASPGGDIVHGPVIIDVACTLSTIPRFTRVRSE